MSEVVVEEVQQTFIRSKTELDTTVRKLKKITPKAIDFLLEIMENDTLDVRVRQKAAKDLIDLNIDLAKWENADRLNRMIAEIKVLQRIPLGGKTKDSEDDEDKPVLDFSNIKSLD